MNPIILAVPAIEGTAPVLPVPTELAVLLASIVAGAIAVPLLQVLKRRLAWYDDWAYALALGVSVLLGALVCFMSQMLMWTDFTATNVSYVVGVVLSVSLTVYRYIVKEKDGS